MGLATFAQTILIDNDYAKDGTVLRFKDNKYSKGVYLYDSTLGTDSICGIAACVCNIDKRGNVKEFDVLWFFQKYPTKNTYMKKTMDSHLYKTIVDNLQIQIRKNGVIVCPSNVKIKGTRVGWGIPIVIKKNKGSS